ncbi:UNVERIFIED_ORG: hypothetical protein ABIB52_000564 [Arthrobacter sp. UYCu721]
MSEVASVEFAQAVPRWPKARQVTGAVHSIPLENVAPVWA